MKPLARLLIPAIFALALTGCEIIAAPIHVTADVVDLVPVVGPVVAAPVEATADTID